MTNDNRKDWAMGGEWLLAFSGVGLVSVLVTLFLLNDPYWKLASYDAPMDETSSAMVDLFDNAETTPGEPIAFAFANDVLMAGAPALPSVAFTALPAPIEDAGVSVPDDLAPVSIAQLPAEPYWQVGLDDAVMFAQNQAPRGLAMTVVEDRMELSPRQRAVVQRRLLLAGYTLQGVDGVFGEETRAAIASFQAEAGLPETGYLDAPAMIALTEMTRSDYAVWKEARDRRAFIASVVPPEPRPSREVEIVQVDRCTRTPGGEVIAYQGIICDLKGLGESIWSKQFPNRGDDSRLAELHRDRDR